MKFVINSQNSEIEFACFSFHVTVIFSLMVIRIRIKIIEFT